MLVHLMYHLVLKNNLNEIDKNAYKFKNKNN